LGAQIADGLAERPDHVPPELVVDFDYLNPQRSPEEDVYVALKRLHGLPDIVWTPRHGGHWVVTRSDDIRWIRELAVVFSHEEFMVPRGTMDTLFPPSNVDPPYHARFRAVLNSAFTTGAVAKLSQQTRNIAAAIIDELVPRGRCELVKDFGQIMPVILFLSMLNLPTSRREEFLKWRHTYARASDPTVKNDALTAISTYLKEIMDAREDLPEGDLFSRIAAFRRNSRYRDESEIIGMAINVFVGGLDTISNMMAFTIRHLASDVVARQRLLADPTVVPRAAEEFLRRHGLATTARLLKQDMCGKGFQCTKMTWCLLSIRSLGLTSVPISTQ
jgi:cytochrome P450